MVVKFVARAARHASVLDLAMQLQTNVRELSVFLLGSREIRKSTARSTHELLNRNAHGDGRNKTLLRSPLQTRTPRPPQARVLASSWCPLGCCANLTSSLQRTRRNRCLFGTIFPGPCVCHLATGMTRSPTRWCLSMRRSASRSRCSTAG